MLNNFKEIPATKVNIWNKVEHIGLIVALQIGLVQGEKTHLDLDIQNTIQCTSNMG